MKMMFKISNNPPKVDNSHQHFLKRLLKDFYWDLDKTLKIGIHKCLIFFVLEELNSN